MTDELALKRWKALEPGLRKKLESNVYCGKCGVTTIVDYEVEYSNSQFTLKGSCQKCHGSVARVVD
ncbi:hypothetical protein AS034_15790 [[Bacillus] enclensis]|uniref:Uncharacterized protein n=1 Tax=[Bacillus] enclensis TaxID=1402860 RepID=A0A0V8HDA8_9BACI|nr:hypothetical protein [[Bacillus] enclensis]KSU60305.1 hypothetical protein AS034_15790 [[Bacillus] enclensis]QWC22506.1 hypothetical protein KJK41_19985 [Bacillus haikouensis]SCC22920.1 hypothetical protein GA0061094_3267 [[Bacillus] enclensis]